MRLITFQNFPTHRLTRYEELISQGILSRPIRCFLLMTQSIRLSGYLIPDVKRYSLNLNELWNAWGSTMMCPNPK